MRCLSKLHLSLREWDSSKCSVPIIRIWSWIARAFESVLFLSKPLKTIACTPFGTKIKRRESNAWLKQENLSEIWRLTRALI